MSSVGPIPPAPVIPSHLPMGRAAVGNESAEDKERLLAPVEESSEQEKLRNRLKADDEQQRRQSAGRDSDDTEELADTATSSADRLDRPLAADGFRIVPTVESHTVSSRAIDAFSQPSADQGNLLDQHI